MNDADGSPPDELTPGDVFRAFFASAPDAVVLIDLEGRMTLVNDQTEALFGYPRRDLVGHPVEILIPERFRGAHRGHRGRYATDPRTRPMGAGLDLYGLRSDGTEFPVDISLSPLRTSEGILLSAAIRDVTERKALEAARDDFIANAAHELRTPMATLAMLGESLGKNYRAMDDATIHRALQALSRQSERASTLVSNLLDLSQVGSGRMTISLQAVDVTLAVSNVRETAPPPEGVRLSIDIVSGAIIVADPVRFEQVLLNLLVNAYRYGGPNVAIRAAPDGGGDVMITVEDDGPGIPPELEPTAFEPFTRGRDASQVGGSGIGLALCRGFVARFGGTLRYQRGVPTGSCFLVTLKKA